MKLVAVRLAKGVTHALLIAGLLFSSLPRGLAEDLPRAEKTMRRMRLRSPLRLTLAAGDAKNLREQFEKTAKEKPKEALVGVSQTLMVMMLLAGIEMTAEQIHQNGGQAPSPAQLSEIVKNVALKTVNSPRIWTSILMSSGFSIVNKPAVALSQLFLNPRLRASFGPILARGITSTIAFVGWDFGAQLWTEASLLLKTNEDTKIAMSTFGLSRGLITTALAANKKSVSATDAQRSRVAKEMMQNMIIVLAASNLRKELFYNFVRNDLLTGEFQTMLGSFVAAGAFGASISERFPKAGPFVGFAAGAAGAGAAQLVPQSIKDSITNDWQSLRAQALNIALRQNSNSLLAHLTNEPVKPTLGADLNALLKYRDELRSRWITIEWEQMHLEARRSRADLAKTFPAHFFRMVQFYKNDLSRLLQLERLAPRAMSRSEAKALWHGEVVRCSSMVEFLESLESIAATEPRNDELIQSIEAAESRGFNETDAVVSWLKAGT